MTDFSLYESQSLQYLEAAQDNLKEAFNSNNPTAQRTWLDLANANTSIAQVFATLSTRRNDV